MVERTALRLSQLVVCLLLLFQTPSAFPSQSDKFPVGAHLPRPILGAPDSPDVQKYLGLKSSERFRLADIGSKLVLIEFIGAM
jgi:hypothetical protein